MLYSEEQRTAPGTTKSKADETESFEQGDSRNHEGRNSNTHSSPTSPRKASLRSNSAKKKKVESDSNSDSDRVQVENEDFSDDPICPRKASLRSSSSKKENEEKTQDPSDNMKAKRKSKQNEIKATTAVVVSAKDIMEIHKTVDTTQSSSRFLMSPQGKLMPVSSKKDKESTSKIPSDKRPKTPERRNLWSTEKSTESGTLSRKRKSHPTRLM